MESLIQIGRLFNLTSKKAFISEQKGMKIWAQTSTILCENIHEITPPLSQDSVQKIFSLLFHHFVQVRSQGRNFFDFLLTSDIPPFFFSFSFFFFLFLF